MKPSYVSNSRASDRDKPRYENVRKGSNIVERESRSSRDRRNSSRNRENRRRSRSRSRSRQRSRSRSRSRSNDRFNENRKNKGTSKKDLLELFVGNIVAKTSEKELKDFLNKALRDSGLVSQNTFPIVEIKLNNMFGFVIFDSVDNCSKGLNLNGIIYHGAPLRFDRTVRYNGPKTPHRTWQEISNDNMGPKDGDKLFVDGTLREVFVGNLPSCKESELGEFLGKALQVYGLSSHGNGNPVLSVRFNGKYGFLELRTSEDAANMLNLNGIIFRGEPLRLSRPTRYAGKDQVEFFDYEDIHQQWKRGDFKIATAGPISRVLCIYNMATAAELDNPRLCAELLHDTRLKFGGYGHVLGVAAPSPPSLVTSSNVTSKPSTSSPISNSTSSTSESSSFERIGRVFVMMNTESEAIQALQDMKGGSFDGRVLDIKFYPEPLFINQKYDFEQPSKVMTKVGPVLLPDVISPEMKRMR